MIENWKKGGGEFRPSITLLTWSTRIHEFQVFRLPGLFGGEHVGGNVHIAVSVLLGRLWGTRSVQLAVEPLVEATKAGGKEEQGERRGPWRRVIDAALWRKRGRRCHERAWMNAPGRREHWTRPLGKGTCLRSMGDFPYWKGSHWRDVGKLERVRSDRKTGQMTETWESP